MVRRETRILAAELVGVAVIIVLAGVFVAGLVQLAGAIEPVADDVGEALSSGSLDDVEGYGALVGLLAVMFGHLGTMMLGLLALLNVAFAIPSILFAIIGRVTYRPGKSRRYVVFKVLALLPIALFALTVLAFAFGDGVHLLWLVVFLVEAALVAYSIRGTYLLLRGQGGANDGDGFVPAPEDAR